MADLKTNYKDRLLDTSVNTERKFNLVDSDGNIIASGVSLRDITQYSQTGDTFGAADINKITAKINEQNKKIGTSAISASVSHSNSTSDERAMLVGGVYSDGSKAYLEGRHYLADSTDINDRVGITFDGTNFYAIGRLGGADAVSKKLGSGTLKMVSLGTGQGKSNHDGASVVETFTIPDDIPLENCQVLAVANSAGGSHQSSDGDNASYSMSLVTAVSDRTVTVTCKHSHSHSNRQTLYLNYTVYVIYITI